MNKIPVFVVNLKERTDRLKHIKEQFEGRNEFDLKLIEATKHHNGAWGLFHSFKQCVKEASDKDYDYVVLCEDDHVFTEEYTPEIFSRYISCGFKNNFDILSYGVGGFGNALPVCNGIFWLEYFTGTQFFVIYKRFYKHFLSIQLGEQDNIDLVMSKYSNCIFCTYLQLSYQKSFGYSDVTTRNSHVNVEEYFRNTELRFSTLLSVTSYYERIPPLSTEIEVLDLNMPVYILDSQSSDIQNLSATAYDVFMNRSEYEIQLPILKWSCYL